MNNTKESTATIIQVHYTKSSWGIFCYGPNGDLFLNSDWGMHGYAWRSFGSTDFGEWLCGMDAEYIVRKFEYNYAMTNHKKMSQTQINHLVNLVNSFIEHLKNKYDR